MTDSCRSRSKICLIALALAVLGATGAPDASAQQDSLSTDSRVSLITILPGDPVYTFAGHSAFRVYDPQKGIDRLYNYGTFDFNDPLFIPKFTYGHLRYFLSVTAYRPTLRIYEKQGRPVISQPLNLTRTQRTALFTFLERNARPENRYYQYDFFYDNCSTRLRDALTESLGDKVDFSGAPSPSRSFRQLLDPYVASRPLLDLGFDLGLGLPADKVPSASEGMFLPNKLMRAFDEASVIVNGEPRPLVARTDTVQWISGYRTTDSAFDWPVATGILFLLTVLAWTSWQAMTNRIPAGWGDALLFFSVGFSGLVICYLWFISTYAVTDNNLNLLWAWPTHLLAATFLITRPSSRRLRVYFGITAVASLIFAAGWPIWPQNLHTAVLPFILGLGVRAGWWALLPSGNVFSSSPHPEPAYTSL